MERSRVNCFTVGQFPAKRPCRLWEQEKFRQPKTLLPLITHSNENSRLPNPLKASLPLFWGRNHFLSHSGAFHCFVFFFFNFFLTKLQINSKKKVVDINCGVSTKDLATNSTRWRREMFFKLRIKLTNWRLQIVNRKSLWLQAMFHLIDSDVNHSNDNSKGTFELSLYCSHSSLHRSQQNDEPNGGFHFPSTHDPLTVAFSYNLLATILQDALRTRASTSTCRKGAHVAFLDR